MMTLYELADAVGAHRERLLGAYRDEEPWEPVRASYGVEALGHRDAELRACLEAVAAWGKHAAQQLGGDEAPVLAARVDELVRDTMKEIAPAPTTGAKAGLAAIFANATAHVGWWKERYGKVKLTDAARCRTCGARQTQALVFDCMHCGQFLYGDPKAR